MPQFNLPKPNEMVPVQDLMELNKALRKNANVGYQTPAQPSGESLSPLVAQSIDNTLTSLTFTEEEIVFWMNIPKGNVRQTVHEYNQINSHGHNIDPFIAEGGAGTTNESTFTRKHVRVKYLAERREVSDVATMTGMLGPNSEALAVETEEGTLRLMGGLEHALFHADDANNALHFTGIIPQIMDGAPDNVHDLRGKAPTAQLFNQILGFLYGAPRYGRPDCIYVEPRVLQAFINETIAHGRHDHLNVVDGSTVTFGVKELEMQGPAGSVRLKAAPFLHTAKEPPSGSAGGGAPATPTIDVQPTHDGGLSGDSQWQAADAGDYIWAFVAVGDEGFSAKVTTNTYSLSQGDKVKIELDDAAEQSADNAVKYYRVYRSKKDGGASTLRHIANVPVNTDGTSSGTQFIDLHERVYNTSRAVFIRHDKRVVEWVQLLDFLRRPLAQVSTSIPFLLMLFGSPVVKAPSKCYVVDNIGAPDGLELE